jgi:Vacuolar protein sorting-associated protein 62
MNTVVGAVFAYPQRFKQIWHLPRGNKPIYAWKAIPPEGYTAIGMIISNSEEPPDVTSMRCVPNSWCIVSKVVPVKVWDDSGAGGGKPGSIWVVNSHGLVAFVAGHEAPKESFYELASSSFSLEEYAVK